MKYSQQNRKLSVRIILLMLVSAAMAAPMSGQTTDSSSLTFHLGLTGALNNVRHTFGFRQLDVPYSLRVEPSNTLGWSAGLEAMFFLDRNWSLALDMRYNSLPGHSRAPLLQDEYDRFVFPVVPEGDSLRGLSSEEVDILYDVSVEYRTLSLDLLVGWRAEINDSAFAVGVNGGPVLYYVAHGTILKSADLISPQEAFYSNPALLPLSEDKRTVYYDDGDIDQKNTVQAGLHIGLFAEFGTPYSGLMITPGISYELGLQPVNGFADSWYIHTLGGNITVSTGL